MAKSKSLQEAVDALKKKASQRRQAILAGAAGATSGIAVFIALQGSTPPSFAAISSVAAGIVGAVAATSVVYERKAGIKAILNRIASERPDIVIVDETENSEDSEHLTATLDWLLDPNVDNGTPIWIADFQRNITASSYISQASYDIPTIVMDSLGDRSIGWHETNDSRMQILWTDRDDIATATSPVPLWLITDRILAETLRDSGADISAEDIEDWLHRTKSEDMITDGEYHNRLRQAASVKTGEHTVPVVVPLTEGI